MLDELNFSWYASDSETLLGATARNLLWCAAGTLFGAAIFGGISRMVSSGAKALVENSDSAVSLPWTSDPDAINPAVADLPPPSARTRIRQEDV